MQLCHHWADFDQTKKSYEMWQRYVMPVVNQLNASRDVSRQRSRWRCGASKT